MYSDQCRIEPPFGFVVNEGNALFTSIKLVVCNYLWERETKMSDTLNWGTQFLENPLVLWWMIPDGILVVNEGLFTSIKFCVTIFVIEKVFVCKIGRRLLSLWFICWRTLIPEVNQSHRVYRRLCVIPNEFFFDYLYWRDGANIVIDLLVDVFW